MGVTEIFCFQIRMIQSPTNRFIEPAGGKLLPIISVLGSDSSAGGIAPIDAVGSTAKVTRTFEVRTRHAALGEGSGWIGCRDHGSPRAAPTLEPAAGRRGPWVMSLDRLASALRPDDAPESVSTERMDPASRAALALTRAEAPTT